MVRYEGKNIIFLAILFFAASYYAANIVEVLKEMFL